MPIPENSPVLLADIGGTHARFALTLTNADSGLLAGSVRTYAVADHDSLEQVAGLYLDDCGERPSRAVMAISGRIDDGVADVANNPWQIRADSVRCASGLSQLQMVNDFVAQSHCLPLLGADDVEPLCNLRLPEIRADRDLTIAVLGPGTGLGVGALLARHGRFVSMESEGGHVNFAPGNAQEAAVLHQLWREHPHVSNERLLSGMGLVNLYRALTTIDGERPRDLGPEQITAAAANGEDALCCHALESFCAILGSVAGDAALLLGAWDGVYLTGGLSPVLLPWLRQPAFRQRFEAKGRRSAIMAGIPCAVVTHPAAGLLGAAAIAGSG